MENKTINIIYVTCMSKLFVGRSSINNNNDNKNKNNLIIIINDILVGYEKNYEKIYS